MTRNSSLSSKAIRGMQESVESLGLYKHVHNLRNDLWNVLPSEGCINKTIESDLFMLVCNWVEDAEAEISYFESDGEETV